MMKKMIMMETSDFLSIGWVCVQLLLLLLLFYPLLLIDVQ